MTVLEEMLRKMVEANASDLHLAVALPPLLRVDGELFPQEGDPLTPEVVKDLAYSILTDEQVKAFEADKELDLSFGIKGLSRFRVNLYIDRGSTAVAIRVVPLEIPTFEELGLPPAVVNMTNYPRGLVLICGPTGSGKSTTLAALINKINQERGCHIITIEDPIEFLHKHQLSVINQREVYADTHSFADALKHILRQDPDVILVGEMRDLETIQSALTIAETGHLVFATLHANDSTQAINRIIDVFPSHQQVQIKTQLSFVLEGIVIQQLLPKANMEGRCLACEVLIPNAAIRNLIREEKLEQVYSAVSTGSEAGMQTMNQALHKLYSRNMITYDAAMQSSSDPADLKNLIQRGQ